jgi:alpha-tubulin suppressor-like RCC1 family protein
MILSGLLLAGCNIQQADIEEAIKQNQQLSAKDLAIIPNFKQLYINSEVQFTASGGTAPYTFSLVSGPGSLNASNKYLAPASAGNAIVRVTDAKGATSDALITIDSELALSPSTSKINVSTQLQLTALGGNPPYTYSVASGTGSISGGGLFTATSSLGTTVVRVIDNKGGIANATIEIGNGPVLSPATKKIPVSTSFAFTTSSGTAPITYSIVSGPGSVDGTGTFTASAAIGTTVIRATDALGFYSQATIESFIKNQIAVTYNATCIMKGSTSEIKCFGNNQTGALGNGGMGMGDDPSDMGDALRPMQLATDRTPTDVQVGAYHVCALLDDNSVQCLGYTGYGQSGYTSGSDNIGINMLGDNILPVPLGAGRSAQQLHAGGNHNCVVMDNNQVKCWGYNGFGQLGQNNTTNWGIDQYGSSLYAVPGVNLGQNATKVVAGYDHSCAILADASVKCWGTNAYGQLGKDDTTQRGHLAGDMAALTAINLGGNNAIDISAGYYFTCALLANGTVRCWGYNAYGQLGNGNAATIGDGAGEMAAIANISFGAGRTAVKIKSGGFHSCALLDNDTLKCWGYNVSGQLGTEDVINRGGNPGDMASLNAIPLGTGRTVKDFSVGQDWTCAILDNDRLKCWGANPFGQLGLGHLNHTGDGPGEMGDNLPYVNFGSSAIVKKISAGGLYSNTTCAIVEKLGEDKAYCWGRGYYGEFGDNRGAIGLKQSDMGSNLVSVNLGTHAGVKTLCDGHQGFCALFNDDRAKCWGYNTTSYHISGYNYTTPLGKPASVLDYMGDANSEMGDNLQYVQAGAGMKLLSPVEGSTYLSAPHACALFGPIVPDGSDPRLKCWGYNGYGQLGQSNFSNYTYIPTTPAINLGVGRYATQFSVSDYHHTCARLDNGTVKCWGHNPYGQLGTGDVASWGTNVVGKTMADLPAIDLGTGVTAKSVHAGYLHSCAVTSDDRLKCWGYNTYGELGQGHSSHIGDGAGEMGDNLPYINLGTGRTVKKLATGVHYSCAILDNDKVKCWGYNYYGQLGTESTASLGATPASMGNNLPYVNLGTGRTALDVKVGHYTTCVLLDNNDVKCWGYNNRGQTGSGTTDFAIGNEVGELGDNLLPINF